MGQADLYHGDNVIMADYTPGSAVTAGDVVVQSDIPTIAHLSIAASALGAMALAGGVYSVTADGAIAAGKLIYWDDTANKVTLTATGNKQFGYAATAAAADGDTIRALHHPA